MLCLHDGRAHGVFYDHPGRVELDLAKADPDRVTVDAADDLVVYVLLGPTPADVLDRYTALTGRTPMPPLWALGNQQSRWSYMSADEVLDRARVPRTRDPVRRALPRHRLHGRLPRVHVGPRAVPGSRRPDRGAALARLPGGDDHRSRREGRRGVRPVRRGPRAGFFCLTREGDEFRNVVWPGLCAFPDFTDSAVREWWGSWHSVLLDAGVAGVWCDMNEPSLFVPQQSTMPEDVVHPGGGRARLHGEVHNAYGSLMAEAARGGAVAAAARRAAVRDLARRLRRASSGTRCSGRATTRPGGSTCG